MPGDSVCPVGSEDNVACGYLDAEPAMINSIEISDDGSVGVEGWVLPPLGENANTAFLLNGNPFDQIEYPIYRPEIANVVWRRRGSSDAAFYCRTKRPLEDLFGRGYLDFRVQYDGRPVRWWFHDTWFYLDPRWQIALPDPRRRFRVVGSESDLMFCMAGFTDFMRMDLLLREFTGNGYDGRPCILDWGCGCGRVARYFAAVPHARIYGADVDADNIGWCAQNLTFGSFRVIPLYPPTEFAAEIFDLIYGISVFTHLRESVQFAWLEELHRITKPGSIVLMTIHGRTTLDYAGVPAAFYSAAISRVQAEGFVITACNDQINGIINDRDYYVNVMHSRDYIYRRWGEYFEILAIIPGFIYTHDMVVMRKRT
jgi:SAM-dependent methyltransferase